MKIIHAVVVVVIAALLFGCASTGSHYEYGMQYYEAGKLDEAIEQFQRSISVNPSDPVVHKALGDVFADKGMLFEAVTEWEVAVKLKPSYEEVKAKLEASYMSLGEEDWDKGKVESAKELWRRALELNKSNLEAHRRLGIAYYQEKDFSSAIPELEWVTEKNSTDVVAFKK